VANGYQSTDYSILLCHVRMVFEADVREWMAWSYWEKGKSTLYKLSSKIEYVVCID